MFRKTMCVILAVSMLMGCSSGSASAPATPTSSESKPQSVTPVAPEQPKPQEQEGSGRGVSVENKLFDVELTLPASFFDDETPTELTDEQKENGFKSMKANEDGSVTYKIGKSEYDKLLKKIHDSAFEAISNISNDFASVVEIKMSSDFKKATIIVERQAFENSFDGFVVLGLWMQSSFCQMFAGVKESDMKLTMDFQDNNTSEIFDTVIYPDALGN